jgi:hypothetical protein
VTFAQAMFIPWARHCRGMNEKKKTQPTQTVSEDACIIAQQLALFIYEKE